MAEDLVLAIDQGTGSTKTMLVDLDGRVVAEASVALGQSHPHPGWVEQDAEAIWASVQQGVRTCVAEELADRVAGVALSVQRETVVLWERQTARAVAPALSWQDQRTADRATALEDAGHAPEVLQRTGLPLDPMFSALKAGWLLDAHDPERTRARSGDWCVGTIDAWVLAHFGGETVTEIGNASRTQLLDLDSGDWDQRLLELFGVPRSALPQVVASVGPFPTVRDLAPLPDGLPVLAVMADSHAALFAHAGWRPGIVKATYGTGSSVMALGPRASATSGVCATIAWQVDQVGPLDLALEANIRSTGRTVTWLAELLGVDVDTAFEWARTSSSDGITLVPAFGGLGAPWWDRDATPLLSGFSLGTRGPHVARAALESIAFQVDDAVAAFAAISGPLAELACDGGMTRSTALMQLQADLSGLPVRVSPTPNLSALGVAHLAGVQLGWWSLAELEAHHTTTANAAHGYTPRTDPAARHDLRSAWLTEVARSRGATQPARADEKAAS